MRRLNKRGQSILEYVIILTAIIAGIILATPEVKTKVTDLLTRAGNRMQTEVTTKLNF
ncbi:MAG: hypothetical protein JSV30_06155 [Candidatus Omnitrophota bacterium]|nr:MAG: hypothetical protein JSV30_06155 [Candidatus Omnitrophota bacterium]